MEFLFALQKGETLATHIAKLSKSDLMGLFGQTIYGRGYEYFKSRSVYKVDAEADKIKAKVQGSENYKVKIKAEGTQVFASCSCPYDYGDHCKHIAATLMHLQSEFSIGSIELATVVQEDSQQALQEYLNGLSKSELVDLVKKYAPDSFKKAILMKNSSKNVQEAEFKRIAKKFLQVFDDEHLMYDIGSFEAETNRHLEKFRAFWQAVPDELLDVFLSFMRLVQNAFDEGQLYDDYGDNSYGGEDMARYMAEFMAVQSEEFIEVGVESILLQFENQNYSVFENFLNDFMEAVPAEKLKNLIPLFLKKDFFKGVDAYTQTAVYEKLQIFLNTDEQVRILRSLSGYNDSFVVALADLYLKMGKINEAIEVLDQKIKESDKDASGNVFVSGHYFSFGSQPLETIFKKRIEIEHTCQADAKLQKLTKQYVQKIPKADSLRFLLSYVSDTSELESEVERRNVLEYCQFLESQNRLKQAQQLVVKRQELLTYQYKFYGKHKKTFPEQAKAVFKAELDKELAFADRSHYHKVAEILLHLKEIESKPDFAVQVAQIKATYKRRSALMEILRNEGL